MNAPATLESPVAAPRPGAGFAAPCADDGAALVDTPAPSAPARAAAASPATVGVGTYPELIWFGNRLVPWASATVHVMTHALHYGSSVFEGMRCYDTPRGPALFRAREHLRRLADSARVYRMTLPLDLDGLLGACRAVVRENGLTNAYLRPLAWRGAGALSVSARNHPVELMIAALPWGPYLGDGALEAGVDVGVSSWAKPAPNTIPTGAKAGGNYLSGQLVAMEAEQLGYAEGIALDTSGTVSEGSGENVFLVRDGVIVTPPSASSILSGITRDTILTLARERGIPVREERVPREALYAADEIFFTGTAAEVTPVRSVDGVVLGDGRRGPVTAALQRAFFAHVRGETPDRHGWLTYVHDEEVAA
ncbi:MAG: branched-chain amino acid transaminase [Gemmatirosa sp.]|nr:branched-chain amino acid transaminase [Gemmatirosa sp.]